MKKPPSPTHNALGLPLFTDHGDEIHWVRTSVLSALVNPYKGCWRDLEKPLSLSDVKEALNESALPRPQPETFSDLAKNVGLPPDQSERRKRHARKTAWFVRHGFQKPLSVDVGVPSMGCHVRHLVDDGNHRLAAAIYRSATLNEDPLLPLIVSGSVNHAKSLGLWVDHP